MGDYNDVAVAAYEAKEQYNGDELREDIARILAACDADEPWRVVGRVEGIPLKMEECRKATEI